MNMTLSSRFSRALASRAKLGICMLALISVAACELLDVASPTVVDEDDLNNPTGAELTRVGVIRSMGTALASSSLIRQEALFTDELRNELPTSASFQAIDRRAPQAETNAAFGVLNTTRNMASEAIRRLRANNGPTAYVGQMFAVRGYVKLLLGQDFCPGFAFNSVDPVTRNIVYGPALTTQEAFESAIMDLDTAVVLSADTARILDFAKVVRGRILLELGRYEEAAAPVIGVATNYVYSIDQAGGQLFNFTASRYSVANLEGGVGLNNYQAANDPRVRTQLRATLQPGSITLYSLEKYPALTTPVPIVTGIEARLIEAEAALQAGSSTWLTILNDLRATAITPAMSALADPGTAGGRVNLLFRERAFWLFGTAHRLGDMRRLVRQYNRTIAQVFPGGTRTAGDGGTWDMTVTTFNIPDTELQNPNVTGCTAR